MNKKLVVVVIALVAIVVVIYFGFRSGAGSTTGTAGGNATGTVRIVAAENFYGDIASQLGGSHVSVDSILSNPNVDPHEYESSVTDGIAINDANIVIENGLEYDTWIDKLISASPNPNRIVITAGNIVPDPLPDNPHVWYGIDNIPTIARAITTALEKNDPADTAYFESSLTTFDSSLAPLTQKITEIKAKYSGTPVGLTETIYLYQTQPMGLDVLTPFDFEKAVAEGNDPSAQDVATTDAQVNDKQIKVLIYNSQTVTPITTNLQNAAETENIPIVPVSETMPPNVNYQTWMLNEMNNLEQDLAQATGH